MSDEAEDVARGRLVGILPFHVMPVAGRKHEASTSCWCKPSNDKNPSIWVHRLQS